MDALFVLENSFRLVRTKREVSHFCLACLDRIWHIIVEQIRTTTLVKKLISSFSKILKNIKELVVHCFSLSFNPIHKGIVTSNLLGPLLPLYNQSQIKDQ